MFLCSIQLNPLLLFSICCACCHFGSLLSFSGCSACFTHVSVMHIQATHSHHKLLSVFHSEAENICPVHAFTLVGKIWDGCHGSMPPTVVTWCLKATCCCFLYVAYFPDVGTVGNNECCCRSNDVGNFFLPFPYLSFPLTLPHPRSSVSLSAW